MGQHRGDAVATDMWVKRRPPSDRDAATPGATWMLLVLYRANGDEHAARLPLTDDTVAARVERLLEAVRLGQRKAALDLYACLHNEWGRTSLVGRHPAWDAVFRFLAPRAALAPVEM